MLLALDNSIQYIIQAEIDSSLTIEEEMIFYIKCTIIIKHKNKEEFNVK